MKKAKKNNNSKPSLLNRARSQWLQKLPVLFFVLGFAVLMILFYLCWLSDFFQTGIQPHIVSVNARISSFILNIFGMKTTVTKEVIASTFFSISIARGCDGMEAMALFATAILAFPSAWKFKIMGVLAGVALLFMLNIVRIISLFYIGLKYPKIFEFMHVEVWQAIFIIVAIGLWIFWIKWSRREVRDAAK
ncbi:MAG: exosortase H [Bacteroidota bacterium]